jgi:hypothetical protein
MNNLSIETAPLKIVVEKKNAIKKGGEGKRRGAQELIS